MFKWAQIGDLQMPYQDDRAVALWFKIMRKYKPDAIDIVGDIDDFLEFSSYSDGTTDEFFNQLSMEEKDFGKSMAVATKAYDSLTEQADREAFEWPEKPTLNPVPYVMQVSKGAREFYTKISEDHPDADKFSALGNHDIRVFNYIDKKAPLFKPQITPDSLWDFKNLGIGYSMYEEPPVERFGGFHVHHGTTTSDTGPAVQKDIEKFQINLIRGHDHRGGVFYRNYPMANRELTGVATGHMCDPKAYGLKYTINHSWQLGFSTVEIDEMGNAFPEFHKITPDYTCNFRGRLFKG